MSPKDVIKLWKKAFLKKACTHIHYLSTCPTQAWNKTKDIVGLCFSSISISSFLVVFFLPVSLSSSRLFLHLLLSLIPLPSSPLLFSISPSCHTCSLFQSWAASKLVCVCVCHLKDSSQTPHTRIQNTHINTVHSNAYVLTRIQTISILFTCTHTNTHTELEHGI